MYPEGGFSNNSNETKDKRKQRNENAKKKNNIETQKRNTDGTG